MNIKTNFDFTKDFDDFLKDRGRKDPKLNSIQLNLKKEDSSENLDVSFNNNFMSSLNDILKSCNNEINISNNINKLLLSNRKGNSKYEKLILSKNSYYKKSPYSSYLYLPNCDKKVFNVVNELKRLNFNISDNKIVYFESKNDDSIVYLDNGLILTLNVGGLVVKDYNQGVTYNYKIQGNKCVLNNIRVGDLNNDVLEIKYSEKKCIVKNLLSDNDKDDIVFSIEDRFDIDSITMVDGDIYFSNGMMLQKNNGKYKVIDRIAKLEDIAMNEVGNTSSKYIDWFYDDSGYQGTDWCAVFVSWLYGQLPGKKQYFYKTCRNWEDKVVSTKGQNCADDFARYSVKDNDNKVVYGTWIDINNRDIYGNKVADENYSMPRAGDLVTFNPNPGRTAWPANGRDKYLSSHVGYVYKVDDEKIYTIEGNADSDDASLSHVVMKEYAFGTKKYEEINGFYRPNY